MTSSHTSKCQMDGALRVKIPYILTRNAMKLAFEL